MVRTECATPGPLFNYRGGEGRGSRDGKGLKGSHLSKEENGRKGQGRGKGVGGKRMVTGWASGTGILLQALRGIDAGLRGDLAVRRRFFEYG